MFGPHVGVMCVPGATHQVEIRKQYQIPWNWSYGGCESPCGIWKSYFGPLHGQQVLLEAELASSIYRVPSVCKDLHFNGTHVQAKGDRKKLLNNLATAQRSMGGGGGQDSKRDRETA